MKSVRILNRIEKGAFPDLVLPDGDWLQKIEPFVTIPIVQPILDHSTFSCL
jgi:hypothetical protein